MEHNNILGIVLAGGKSKRFGTDKSQVKLGEKLLINYILEEIYDEFDEILIVANDPIKFNLSKKIIRIEDYIQNLGPLGGVLSAMKWVKDNKKNYKWISTFPIDSPFFKKKHLKTFYEKIDFTESNLFFMKSENTRHNIFGLWSINLYEKLEADISRGDRKVEIWANTVGVKTIDFKIEKNDPFFNINTKEDLAKAKKILNYD